MRTKFSIQLVSSFNWNTLLWPGKKRNRFTERILDSLNKNVKKPILLDKVKYTAKDCVYINRKDNKLILYNEAELYYQDIELRAGIIILDYKTNEVNAGRIEIDSTLVQFPYFKQANNEVNPDSIRFNFDTQKH